MIFDDHSRLSGEHAFLGASKYQWLNYDDETLDARFISSYAKSVGTIIHNYAAILIAHRIKLHRSDRTAIQTELVRNGIPEYAFDVNHILENLVPYVNDGINYKMEPEQVLYYSDICFGTADTIQYYDKKHILRIHDLKTGSIPAHWEQLQIYAALFFLEYGKRLDIRPGEVDTELRIYQNGETNVLKAEANDIVPFIDAIVTANKHLQNNFMRQTK